MKKSGIKHQQYLSNQLGLIYLGRGRIPQKLDVFMEHLMRRLKQHSWLTVKMIAREYHIPPHVIYSQLKRLKLSVKDIRAGREL